MAWTSCGRRYHTRIGQLSLPAGHARTGVRRLGLFAVFIVCISYRDNDVASFMPLLDITVRFHDLIQRIDPVNGRFELARLDQSFEQEQIFELVAAV
jgi:hypothetical protein